ncbi:MAG TPA: UbiA family prenyltransferase [Cytophagaceae bacterium]
MPFFLFAVSQSEQPDLLKLVLSFVIIHFLFYPASNGYNSYFDKDENSIGGLEIPPPVDKELYFTSLFLDFVALVLGIFIGWEFVLMLLVIGLASKAYSHPWIRLKKLPFTGLFTVVFFQGAYTYLMSYMAINNSGFEVLLDNQVLFSSFLCSFLLFASYPMTQVYQHEEDGRRGDLTVSRVLGIRGTFVWTTLVFVIGAILFFIYFNIYYTLHIACLFFLFLLPTLFYFLYWFYKVVHNQSAADYKNTMRLNLLSSLSFIGLFGYLLLMKYVN